MVAGGIPLAGADARRVGEYDPFVELHRGHYGALWAATGSAGGVVALRVVTPGMPLRADDEAQLFETMRAMKGKELAGSVPLLDVLRENGALGLVSAYVDGFPLDQVLRQTTARNAAFSLPVALRIAADLASGVAVLHQEAAYLPGGLTSDAVLLGADGQARYLEPSAGAAAGRIAVFANHRDHVGYRAPEQLAAEPPAATAASDVFSLGALLWELLRNVRLFKGFAASQIRRAIAEQVPERLSETASGAGVPADLAELVARALQPDPARRFADGAELLDALEAVPGSLASPEEVASVLADLLGTSARTQQIRNAVKERGGAARPASGAAPRSRPPTPAAAGAKPLPAARPLPALPATKPLLPAKPPLPRGPLPPPPAAPPLPARPGFSPLPARPPPSPAGSAPAAKARGAAPTAPRAAAPLASKLGPPRAPLPASPRDEPSPVPAPAAPPPKETAAARTAELSAPPSSSGESIPPPDSGRLAEVVLPDPDQQRQVGRCELFAEIARGGMATIHLGRWLGAGGFAKTVAVKALYPQYARDPDFVKMFLDEARVVARIRHPNVMPTLDLVDEKGELFIIMDYVHGVTLTYLTRKAHQSRKKIPVGVTLRIALGMLNGLHAAHEATNERGEAMCVIHRDVSPENVLIGVDGFPRLIDFGIASALGNLSSTREGQVKGKFAYLAPEQVLGDPLTRRTDVYSAAVVLWQVLTGKRLFKGENLAEMTYKILHGARRKPSDLVPSLPAALDAVVMKGLAIKPAERWESAEEMADAIEALGLLAPQRQVAKFVREIAAKRLERMARLVEAVESAPTTDTSEIIDGGLTVRPAARNSIPAGDELAALSTWGASEDDDISLHADVSQSGADVSPPATTDVTSESDAKLAEAEVRSPIHRLPTRLVAAGGVLGAVALVALTALVVGGDPPQPAADPSATATSSTPVPPPPTPTAAPTVAAVATGAADAGAPEATPDAGSTQTPDAGASDGSWPSTKSKVPWPKTTGKTKSRLPSDI